MCFVFDDVGWGLVQGLGLGFFGFVIWGRLIDFYFL